MLAGDTSASVIVLTISGSISYLLYKGQSGFSKYESILTSRILTICLIGCISTNRMLTKLTLYIVASGAITRLVSLCSEGITAELTSTYVALCFVCSSFLRVLDLILVRGPGFRRDSLTRPFTSREYTPTPCIFSLRTFLRQKVGVSPSRPTKIEFKIPCHSVYKLSPRYVSSSIIPR